MDFGLARPTSDAIEPAGDLDSISGSVLTEATVGRVAGSPAYMAPEQAVAASLTPAADQFAFCVSLWEGICAERPFQAPTYPELLRNISEGRVRTPPKDRRPPQWLKRALLRGMRAEVADRWPSMTVLLETLERGRGRWRWQAGIGALVVVAIPLGLVAQQRQRKVDQHQALLDACDEEGAAILDTWNDTAEARLREGLLSTGVAFAEDSFETIVPWLDAYTESWRAGRVQACLHTSVQQDWTAEQSDRSMWCFEDRQLQLAATVEQISGGDAKAARRAVRLASYLDPVEVCLDLNLLERLPAPPTEIRDTVRAIRTRLIAVDRLRHAGMYADALEEARATSADAQALGWPPLLASTHMIEGRCLVESGRVAESDAVLNNAYFEARAAGSSEVAFRAARSLVKVNAALQRHREAETWARHADAISSDKVDLGGLDEAEGHYLLVDVYSGLGDYAAAAEQGELAIEQRRRTLGPEHPITAAAVRNLGVVYLRQDRPREALELFEQATPIWRDAVGPDHPHVAGLMMLRGLALLSLGRLDDALSSLQASLKLHAATLRSGHPSIASNLEGLGQVYTALGRLDEADEALARATSIDHQRGGVQGRAAAEGMLYASVIARKRGQYDLAAQQCEAARQALEAVLEPGHPELARATEALADVYLDRGQPQEAIALRTEALASRESARGRAGRQLVTPLVQLGDAQQEAGLTDDARESYQRALTIAEAVAGEADAAVVLPLSGLAEIEFSEGRASEAVRYARRATDVSDAARVGPRRSRRAFFVLARALAASGAPTPEARAAAEQAREAYAAMHETAALAEIDAWLEVNGAAP